MGRTPLEVPLYSRKVIEDGNGGLWIEEIEEAVEVRFCIESA